MFRPALVRYTAQRGLRVSTAFPSRIHAHPLPLLSRSPRPQLRYLSQATRQADAPGVMLRPARYSPVVRDGFSLAKRTVVLSTKCLFYHVIAGYCLFVVRKTFPLTLYTWTDVQSSQAITLEYAPGTLPAEMACNRTLDQLIGNTPGKHAVPVSGPHTVLVKNQTSRDHYIVVPQTAAELSQVSEACLQNGNRELYI